MSLRMKTHKVKRKTDTGGFCIRAQDDVPVHTVHPSTQTEQFSTLSNAQFLWLKHTSEVDVLYTYRYRNAICNFATLHLCTNIWNKINDS